MANVTITIPDQYVARVVHALCSSIGLPESSANAKEAILLHIRAVVRNVESTEAHAAVQEPSTIGIVE